MIAQNRLKECTEGVESKLTVEDYALLGVEGVTANNLDEVNALVCSKEYADVDTEDEINEFVKRVNNTAPQARATSVEVEKNIAKEITLEGTDTDSPIIEFIIVNRPKNGRVQVFSDIEEPPVSPFGLYKIIYKYYPDGNYIGSDRFTFKVKDEYVESSKVAVDIEVVEPNILPIAYARTKKSRVAQNEDIHLEGRGTDEDGHIVKYEWFFRGDLIATTQNHTLSAPNFDAFWQYTLKVTDNRGGTDTDSVTVNIGEPPIKHEPEEVEENPCENPSSEECGQYCANNPDALVCN